MQARGFILIPVMMTLTLVGLTALLLNRESGTNLATTANEWRSEQARYTAEAGARQARWQLSNNTSCTGYTNVASTVFGSGSFSATVTPGSNSPVTVKAVGRMNDGSAAELTVPNIRTYGPVAGTSLRLGSGNGRDTYITNQNLTQNYGSNATLTVTNDSGKEERALLYFDLSKLPERVSVRSARLRLYLQSMSNTTGVPIVSAFPVVKDWTETGATWMNAANATAWTAAGGDYENRAYATTAVAAINTWYEWDITPLAVTWAASSGSNRGVLLSGSNIKNANFTAANNTTTANAPQLALTYACECGVTDCTTDPKGVAYWKLDEVAGTTAYDDDSSNDGALQNSPAWSIGKRSGGLRFNGSNQFASVPHSNELSLTGDITVTAWINAGNLTLDHTVVTKGNVGLQENYWLGTTNRDLSFGFYDGTAYQDFSTTGLNLSINTWYHVAAVFDNAGDRVTLYLNGAQVGLWTTTAQPLANTQSAFLGRSLVGDYWNGVLDDIRIYDQALSAQALSLLAASADQTLVLVSVADTFLDQQNASTNYGATSPLRIGANAASQSYRSMYRFDLSTLPATATVTAADLKLVITNVTGLGSFAVGSYRVTGNWAETSANWSNTNGDNVAATPLATLTVPMTVGVREWLLPPTLMQEWRDGITPNYGVQLRFTGSATGTQVRPAAREDNLATNRPQLIINYRLN